MLSFYEVYPTRHRHINFMNETESSHIQQRMFNINTCSRFIRVIHMYISTTYKSTSELFHQPNLRAYSFLQLCTYMDSELNYSAPDGEESDGRGKHKFIPNTWKHIFIIFYSFEKKKNTIIMRCFLSLILVK